MNRLCFYWDDNVTLLADVKAQERLLKQWTHTAKGFGIYHLLVVGNAPPNNDAEITIESFTTYQEIRDKYSTEQYVVLIEAGTDMDNFTALSGDLIYVLGSNYSDPIVIEGDVTVGLSASIPLWDVVAAGIVLYGIT